MPLQDYAVQKDRNHLLPRMRFETETSGCVFGELFISVPVALDYWVSERNGIQEVRNVSIRVAGIHEYDWEDVPWHEREHWRRQMVDAWNAKHGLVLRKVSA